MSRRSRRLSGKADAKGKRMSIGDAMGLKTPVKPQATNLRQTKAMETALAAAAKMVSNNAKKSRRRVRTPNMSAVEREAKEEDARMAKAARLAAGANDLDLHGLKPGTRRYSLALRAQTKKLMDESDESNENSEDKHEDMPPLVEDTEESGDERDPKAQQPGHDKGMVRTPKGGIATPGPPSVANTHIPSVTDI